MSIQIFDTFGKLVLREVNVQFLVGDNVKTMDIQNLPAGIYHLLGSSKTKNYSASFTKIQLLHT